MTMAAPMNTPASATNRRRSMSVVRLVCCQLGVTLLLILCGPGCISIPMGAKIHQRVPSKQRVEKITDVMDVEFIPSFTRRGLEVDVRERVKYQIEEQTTATEYRTPMYMDVGLFVYYRNTAFLWQINRQSSDLGAQAAAVFLGPFQMLMMNFITLGYPTVRSLVWEPFDAAPPENNALNHQSLIGCYRYDGEPIVQRVHVKQPVIVQDAITRWQPLPLSVVECDIPSARYNDKATTDSTGKAVFPVRVSRSEYADVKFTLREIGVKETPEVRGGIVGRSQTHRMILEPIEGVASSVVGRSLPVPDWPIEAVALSEVSASSGVPPATADAMTEWLYNSLGATRYYKLVARADTKQVLKEQALQRSGVCDDNACLVEVGKILAVQRMIGAHVSKLGESILLTARVIDVETSEMLATASGKSLDNADAILAMVRDVTESLCREYAKTVNRRGTGGQR